MTDYLSGWIYITGFCVMFFYCALLIQEDHQVHGSIPKTMGNYVIAFVVVALLWPAVMVAQFQEMKRR